MARTNTLLSARNLADLITLANALFAPLLSHKIVQATYAVVDEAGVLGQEYTLAVQYETGGAAMSDPYVMEQFGGDNPVDTMVSFIAFVAANPALFIAQPRYWPFTTEKRRTRLYPIVSFSSVDAANGLTNWLADGGGSSGGGGGAPTGPAGGDLGGTYPNPDVFAGELAASPGAGTPATLDSVAVASFRSIPWALQARKGTTTYTALVTGNNDGTTGGFTQGTPVLAPPVGGTFDFAVDVDVSGGNMRLRVTPTSGGWTFKARRLGELST